MILRQLSFLTLLVAFPLALNGCGDGDGASNGGVLDGGGQDGDGNGGLDGGVDGGDNGGDTDAGDDNGGDTDAGDDNGGDTDAGVDEDAGVVIPLPDGGTHVCYPAPCQGEYRECGDCIDNDGDGLIDDQDPNCLGPCDNNESGFDLQIDGAPNAPCDRDCYFDKDSGHGNDGCQWARQCDPLQPVERCSDRRCNDTEEQDPMCLEVCGPLVPAGCDCFGCCDIRTDAEPDQENWIFLGSEDEDQEGTCNMELAKAGDEEACRPCTPLEECWNPCGECDLCLGRTVEDLPEHCFPSDDDPDGGVPDGGMDGGTDGGTDDDRCGFGQQPCGLPGDDPCPDGHFCLTGCCVWAG